LGESPKQADIQNITLFGSLARDESTASSDALVHFREVERDAVSI
jgi:predicted nucleotidyltransferase